MPSSHTVFSVLDVWQDKECCTHIASVLFYIEAWNRVNQMLSCTQVKCSWLIPTAVKDVPVSGIDFKSRSNYQRFYKRRNCKKPEAAKVSIPVYSKKMIQKKNSRAVYVGGRARLNQTQYLS